MLVTGKTNIIREIIVRDGKYTIRDIAEPIWHIALAVAFYFEANFESTKDFCQIYSPYIDRRPKKGMCANH
jgi:hypothetical protein